MSAPDFHIPRLETERLILRAPEVEDFEPLAAFYASDRAQFVGGRKSPEEVWHFLSSTMGHWALRGYGMWTVTGKGNNTGLGLVGLYNPQGWPECELGWHIWDGQMEGCGFANEAALASLRFAYGNLEMRRLVSYVVAKNTRSSALAKRLGAVPDPEAERLDGWTCQVWRHPMTVASLSGDAPGGDDQ